MCKNVNKIANNKILIEALHGLGDVVCMLPMIKEIREKYPEAEITVLVKQPMAVDIISCSGIEIDFCIVLYKYGNIGEILKKCRLIRKNKFDIAIESAITPIWKSKIFMKIVNPKNKFGIQFKYSKNFKDFKNEKHLVEAHLMAIEDLVVCQHGYIPQLIPNQEALQKMYQLMSINVNDIVIGVCIGRANIFYKNKLFRTKPIYPKGWGEYSTHVHYMEVLVNEILMQGWKIILIGGKEEKKIRDSLSDDIVCNINVNDMVGKTTLSESIALAAICDVMVGVDTGMQHIADAVGTKSVSIFGPTDPQISGAYSNKALFAEADVICRSCFGTPSFLNCTDRRCMHRVTPEDVFKLIYKSVFN